MFKNFSQLKNGVTKLVEEKDEMYMNVDFLKCQKNETFTFNFNEEEAAFLLIQGEISIRYNDKKIIKILWGMIIKSFPIYLSYLAFVKINRRKISECWEINVKSFSDRCTQVFTTFDNSFFSFFFFSHCHCCCFHNVLLFSRYFRV